MQSTCGLIRSSGSVISRGARVTAPAVVTMPCSPSRRARVPGMSWPFVARSATMADRASGASASSQPGKPASVCLVCLPTSASRSQMRAGPACRYSATAVHSPTQAATLASPAPTSHSGLLSAGRAAAGRAAANRPAALTFSRSHQGSATPIMPTPRGPVSHFLLVA